MASLAGIGLLAVVANLVDGVGGAVNAGGPPAVGPRVQSVLNIGLSSLDRGIDPNEALAALANGIRVARLQRTAAAAGDDARVPWGALEDLGVSPGARTAEGARRATLLAPTARLAVAIYSGRGEESEGGGLERLGIALELAMGDAPAWKGFRRPKICIQTLLELSAAGEAVAGRLQVLVPHDGDPIEPPGPEGTYFEGDELAWNGTGFEAKRWVWRPQEIGDRGGCGRILASAGKARDTHAPAAASLKELVRIAHEALDAVER